MSRKICPVSDQTSVLQTKNEFCSQGVHIPDSGFAERVSEIVKMLRHEMNVSLLREAYLKTGVFSVADIVATSSELASNAKTLAGLLNELVRLFDIE